MLFGHKTTEMSHPPMAIHSYLGYLHLFFMETKLSSVRKQMWYHQNVVIKACVYVEIGKKAYLR